MPKTAQKDASVATVKKQGAVMNSRGAAGAAAGSQRQHHAGSQHEGCELFHVS